MTIVFETPTAYLDLEELQEYIGSTTGDEEAQALRTVRQAARMIELFCRRFFYQRDAYSIELDVESSTQNAWNLPLDLLTITALQADEDMDGVFETDLLADDYRAILLPSHPPYDLLRIYPSPSLPSGLRALKVTGSWGWPQSLVNVDALNGEITADATQIVVADAGNFAIGQTLLIESEQLYVTDKPDGTTLAIQRALNGSSAAIHSTGLPVARIAFPEALSGANGILAARLWRRRETSFAQVIADVSPTIEAAALIDRELKVLLSTYRRMVALG